MIYPTSGYDKRFGTYLVEGAPTLRTMGLEMKDNPIKHLDEEFPFTTEQSRCHAHCPLLTPLLDSLDGRRVFPCGIIVPTDQEREKTIAPLFQFC